MQKGEIEQLFREYTELAWNQRRDDAFDSMVTTEIEVRGFAPSGEVTLSREDLRAGRAKYFELFPELRLTVHRIMVEDNELMCWLGARGMADPAAFGLEGGRVPVAFECCVWAKAVDGKILAGRNLIDFLAVRETLTGKGRLEFL